MPTKTTTKKTASAKVVKKSVSKKAVQTKKRPLIFSDNQTSFWVQDGQVLNNLVALKEAFSTMSKATYTYHTSLDHNDFATWVALVLDDDACAAALQSAKTPAAAKTIVIKHLKLYDV